VLKGLKGFRRLRKLREFRLLNLLWKEQHLGLPSSKNPRNMRLKSAQSAGNCLINIR